MEWKSPPPFDQRDCMDLELLAKFKEYADELPVDMVIGLDPISLLTNASGHPERQTAINLLKQCISHAKELKLPEGLLEFGLEQALKWRSIRFSGSDDQRISASELEVE